ncbi:MAG: hypothetical protein MUC57_03045 [Desulfobacterales bacterium]|jgi:hypothetical protein|nr:hypothetical protein [Desulfobacterales bacterium]
MSVRNYGLTLAVVAAVLIGSFGSPVFAYRTATSDCTDRDYVSGCEKEPTGGMMMWDALVMRPVGIAGTALGSVVWLVSYPFAYWGGNTEASTQALVQNPFEWTFQRPLGDF